MKRKPQPVPEPASEPEPIEAPKWSAEDPDEPKSLAKCEVCGSPANANPVEQLCWVCRRLKISAWRDSEQQMPVQE